MTLLSQLAESQFVKISASPDFDHFRNIDGLGEASSIPLDCKGFAAAFATLRLKSCSLYLQRTFPRILQISYSTTGAIIGLPMQDGTALIVNGVANPDSALLVVKGSTTCEIVERQTNLIGLVNFDAVDNRGWPGEADSAALVSTDPARLAALQRIISDVFTLASHSPDAFAQPNMIETVEESLLQTVDLAMATASPGFEGKRTSLGHYLALVRKFDDFLAANAGKTLYSAEVAQQLGVSVRTLHNAVVAIRGMSMHRYTRLRRLWDVRRQLLVGSSGQSIRAVALVHGFWHMGEFASLYRELFGETPQQTLLAARKQSHPDA